MRTSHLATALACSAALLLSGQLAGTAEAAPLAPTSSTSALARKKPSAAPLSPNAYAARLVVLTNLERAKVRRKPLRLQACLVRGAQAWSTQMARTSRFDHQHLGWVGSRCGFHRIYGENIAAGYRTPEQMMAAWMASPGHRQNLLNPAYTHLGIGYTSAHGGYATQDLAG